MDRPYRWSKPGMWACRSGVLGACLASLLFVATGCSHPPAVGDPAPDFAFRTPAGAVSTLASVRGRVVLLHFWATWCPPCIVELPRLARLAEGLDPERFAVMAVCVDNDRPEKVRDFVATWGISLPLYLDPGGVVARKFGTIRFPETFVLDGSGVVRKKVIGAEEWRRPVWVRFLQSLQETRAGDVAGGGGAARVISPPAGRNPGGPTGP